MQERQIFGISGVVRRTLMSAIHADSAIPTSFKITPGRDHVQKITFRIF